MPIAPGDVGLFIRSARSDARLTGFRETETCPQAFDRLYATAQDNDPWASASTRYAYQRRKYDKLAALLPKRRFARALDLGCGLGLFAERLTDIADEVTGLDVSAVAIGAAAERTRHLPQLGYVQGDLKALDPALCGQFDLVTVADTIYYLPPPIDDVVLKAVVPRVAALLRPGGLLLVANHYFFRMDPESRLSRRIQRAFYWSPALVPVAEHRRAFFLASLFAAPSLA